MKPKASVKTNLAGIGAILGGISTICVGISKDDYSVIGAGLSAIVAGIGLLCARDNDVTSEESGAKDAANQRAYDAAEKAE